MPIDSRLDELGAAWRQAHRSRLSEEGREPSRLCLRNGSPERRDPVIPPSFIVVVGALTIAEFVDEALFEHPSDRSVQRAWTQLERAVGSSGDILHDRVAMTILISDGNEDVKGGDWQWQQVARIRRWGHSREL